MEAARARAVELVMCSVGALNASSSGEMASMVA